MNNSNFQYNSDSAQLQQAVLDAQKEIQRLERQLQRQQEYNANLQENYNLIVNSGGHRLLERYYGLRKALSLSNGLNKIKAMFAPMLQKLTHLKNRLLGTLTREDIFQILGKSKQFQILPTESSSDIAADVHRIFTDAGMNSTLLPIGASLNPSVPCLLLDPAYHTVTSKIYMVFLTKDNTTVESELLDGAYAIWCTSQSQIEALSAQGISTAKLYYCPVANDCFNSDNNSSITPLEYYVNRFLLANDCIDFENFYTRCGEYLRVQTNKLCLTLPECPDRKASFDMDNVYGFSYFPGLKHHIGWIGCGLSYKMIFRLASEQLQENLLLCEDDVFFPPDFSHRWEQICSYLAAHHDWDIFSGIMADMGNVSILEYLEEGNMEYVYINKMMSMVFNLYTPKLYPILAAWNPMLRDKATNTIDRYLENKCSRVITTCPFLVGHKEDLDSTIWNHKNALYNAGIDSSNKRLSLLIAEYLCKQ